MANNLPTVEYAEELLSYLPDRPDYNTWLSAISAIGNTFDKNTALSLLKGKFREEKPNEIEEKLNYRKSETGFGTLVYLAELNGYIKERRHYYASSDYSNKKASESKKKTIVLKEKNEKFYWFEDISIQMEYSKLVNEKGVEQIDAVNYLIEKYPEARKTQFFRVSFNKKIINKNLNPTTKRKNKYYCDQTYYFQNYWLTTEEIIYKLGNGYSMSPSHLDYIKESELAEKVYSPMAYKGKIELQKLIQIYQYCHRNSNNFIESELFAVDIDGSLTIKEALEKETSQKALILYTTSSHSTKEHRFRIIFDLPFVIRDLDFYKDVVKSFVQEYNADENCINPSIGFYGNSNGYYLDIQNKSVYQFKDGAIYEERSIR